MSECYPENALKTVNDLLGKSFFIPKYQRGYRWGKQQVEDLLNDINDFTPEDSQPQYCLQPLVVAQNVDKPNVLDVIDGQQRLTTIFIILKYLQTILPQIPLYTIAYETRKESESFLNGIGTKDGINEENIDFFHMSQCDKTVKTWFEGKDTFTFRQKLLNNVSFIWYEDNTGNPVETFTRLNIDKIPLTNAELIKAMLLKQSNFLKGNSQDLEAFRLKQLEMATQWDEIEFTLQNEDFWYFIHPQEWKKPTRIDFIFDLIMKCNYLDFKPEKDPGKDNYTIFRYFNYFLNQNNKDVPTEVSPSQKEGVIDVETPVPPESRAHLRVWKEVRTIFQIFNEWFNDITFYHYIGFFTNINIVNIGQLIGDFKKQNKELFQKTLRDNIKNTITNLKLTDLTCKKGNKQDWRPLLLLFNIQTVINQNSEYTKKYGKSCFYKFPFYLYQYEKWDIEHIDSATANNLEKLEDQKEWLKNMFLGLEKEINNDTKLRSEIIAFLKLKEKAEVFNDLRDRVESLYPYTTTHVKNIDSIGNFALLDQHTNREYQNSIFPTKRRIIIGKDQGKSLRVELNDNNDELEIKSAPGNASFIPPCTRDVFMKYYTPNSTDIMTWSQLDAKAYIQQIYETLKEFGVQNLNLEQQGGNTNE